MYDFTDLKIFPLAGQENTTSSVGKYWPTSQIGLSQKWETHSLPDITRLYFPLFLIDGSSGYLYLMEVKVQQHVKGHVFSHVQRKPWFDLQLARR